MGKKRSSIRTLDTGEQVRHDPDGEQHLQPENKAQRFLAAISDQVDAQIADQQQALQDAIQAKRDSLDAGNAVPHDKRPV